MKACTKVVRPIYISLQQESYPNFKALQLYEQILKNFIKTILKDGFKFYYKYLLNELYHSHQNPLWKSPKLLMDFLSLSFDVLILF